MWTINGVDPNTYGLKVTEVNGWETAPALSYPTQQVPGRPGLLKLRNTPDHGPRRMQVSAFIIGTSNADMLTKFDQLKAMFSAPALTIIFANRSTRSISARLDGEFMIPPGDVSMVTRKIAVNFALIADDPWYYDVSNTVVSNLAGNVDLPAGTAPVWPVVSATISSGTSTVLTLLNSASVAVASITLSPLAIGEVVVVDMLNKTVKVNGVNALGKVASGDFFALDVARDGNYLTSAWPKMSISNATTNSVTYKKAWR